MLRRTFQTLVVLVGLGPAVAVAQERSELFAERLPAAQTAVYAHISIRRALAEAEGALTFVDADAAQKIVYQVTDLYDVLRELAAGYEFQPTLFDSIADTELHVVVMKKDEPEVRVTKYQVPKFDDVTPWEEGEEEFDFEPTEFEERTFTETKNFTTSLILGTPDEQVAANFMEELKALLDRQVEQSPDPSEFERKDIEVEVGELIGYAEGNSTVGRLGKYIIISDGNPRELWGALVASPEERLCDAALYRRLVETEQKPQAFLVVNTQTLIRNMESELKRKLDEAEESYAARQGGTSGGEGEDQDWEREWELQMVRSSYKAFMVFKELLSLDKWEHSGGSFYSATSEERAFSDFRGVFSHGEPVSSILLALLEGSGSFRVPPHSADREGLWIMARVGLKEIYDEVVSTLRASDPTLMMPFDMAMQMMKMSIGADLGEILGVLAGDFYFFIKPVKKEIEVTQSFEFDEETGEHRRLTGKVMTVVPEITLLWGLNDPQAARDLLNAVFTAMSTNPQLNQFLKKRTYQETDVFCFGLDAAKEESYPEGLTSFGVTIVERYLTAGNWDYVTNIIRRMKSDTVEVDEELQSVVEKYRDSNLLLIVPREFQQHLEELRKESEETSKDMVDRALEALESVDFGLEDEELGRRIKDSLRELILALQQLQARARDLAPQTSVVHGTHVGNFWQIQATSDVTK